MSKPKTKSTAASKAKTTATAKKSAPKPASKPAAKSSTKSVVKQSAKSTTKRAPKSSAKKPAAKQTAKAVTKPVPKPAPKKATTKRETVASLRTHVDSIVARLKTADTNTRKSVSSLENAISALQKQVKSHHKIDHAALAERVDQLSAHLTSSINATKKDIASDLRSALETPTVSGIEAAIERSEQRLADTEMAQAQALSKVNKHLADLARVIDARFRNQEGETKENSAKITDLEQKVGQSYERITAIENLAADAIRKVGDEVVGTAETFQSRLESQNTSLRERIEAIAVRTKEDFDQQTSLLSRRMESIEDSQKNQSNYIDRSISKLAARIDSLEFGLSQPSDTVVAPPPMVPPASPEAAFAQSSTQAEPVQDAFAPVLEVDGADDNFVYPDSQPFEPTHPVTNVPAASEPAAYEVPPAYAPAPVNPPSPLPPAQFTDEGAQYAPPQEYQPQMAQANMAPQHHYVDPAQAAQMAQQGSQATAFAYDPHQVPNPYAEATPEPVEFSQAVEYNPQIADADLPYDNPGYSESGAPEGLTRPGHVTGIREKQDRKKSLKKLFDTSALSNLPITPRNLKVAGLALALATVGYLGLRGLTGGSPDVAVSPPTSNVPAVAQPAITAPTMPVAAAPNVESQISMEDPIGNYQDNTTTPANNIAFQGDQTLIEAADSGNAVAQFQLGISYLDSGQTKKGLDYVRKSANQNQPAAQYRLAKLYEAGIGVTSNPDMARELTERAARSGNRIAMHDLGLYYAEGRGGVDRNLTTALSWFEKAAERGVVDSQYNLGILMGSTPEIPKDMVSSLFWFSVAAAQGDQFAGNQLDTMKAQMTSEEIKQAEARLAEFKPVAIDEAANGIFKEVPWAMPDMQSFAPTSDLVRDAQGLLGQLGYDVGVADGAMGPKTRSAVKAFERANGLPETGSISGSLVDRLEAAAGV